MSDRFTDSFSMLDENGPFSKSFLISRFLVNNTVYK